MIADGGELIVLAPGLKQFGEDQPMTRSSESTDTREPKQPQGCRENEDLRQNLGVATHLIHGSSKDDSQSHTAPVHIDKEVESVGFIAKDYDEMAKIYNPHTLKDGFNTLPSGETIFYISNPALGLWALKKDFA